MDEETGEFPVRESITRGEVREGYFNTDLSMLRYDPHRHEWDSFDEHIPRVILHYKDLVDLPEQTPNTVATAAPPSFALRILPSPTPQSRSSSPNRRAPTPPFSPPRIPSPDWQQAPMSPIQNFNPESTSQDEDTVAVVDEKIDRFFEQMSGTAETSSVSSLAVTSSISDTSSISETNLLLHAVSSDLADKSSHPYAHDSSVKPLLWSHQLRLEDSLYSRYGFSPALLTTTPSAKLNWRTVANILGDKDSQVHKDLAPHICAFVSDMIECHNNINALMSIVDYDISLNAAFPLEVNGHNQFRISSWREEHRIYYLVLPKHEASERFQPDWQLLLSDPAAVLQCMRENLRGSSLAAARYLLASCIPFNTLVPLLPHDKVKAASYAAHSLGFRPHHHKPTAVDYSVYQDIRDRLLSRPYARAAILHGGILARIARHASNCMADLEEHVLNGPSEDAATRGCELHSGVDGYYCDDALNETEKDLICGVYKWATGKLF